MINELTVLHQAINQGATIVTPNRRLSQWIQQQYNQYQQQLSQTIWQTADVLPLDDWLLRGWRTAEVYTQQAFPTLLNEHQERTLWQSIIERCADETQLLNITTTAYAAQQTWQLTHLWQIEISEQCFSDTQESQTFLRWALAFQQYCQQENYIDKASIATMLLGSWSEKNPPNCQQLIFACFNEIAPLYQSLMTTLRQLGMVIDMAQFQTQAKAIYQIPFADPEQEIQAMAKWAYGQLKEGEQQIACIIPDLQAQRNQVERAFSQTQLRSVDYNISLGKPFSQYPMIQIALQILKLSDHFIPLEVVSSVLRSPFLGDAEREIDQRAMLDLALRDLSTHTITLDTIIEFSQQPSSYCPQLAKHLDAFLQIAKQHQQTPSDWAITFSQQWAALGWPGERTLSSEEYQLAQRMDTLLTEFASLDLIDRQLKQKQAITQFEQLAQHIIFQAKKETTPIQILGLLEATGILFDAIWLSGMDDLTYPALPRPNPFIPKQIQRHYNMPHCSAEREIKYAQQTLQHIFHGAKQIRVSYPRFDQQQELHASPLIKNLPLLENHDVDSSSGLNAEKPFEKNILEKFRNNCGPVVNDKEKVQGGSAILKAQAACQFRAFALFRLGANNMVTAQTALSRQEQGLLLHRALEHFWRTTQNWQTLCEYTEKKINQILLKSIQFSFLMLKQKQKQLRSRAWLQLEKKRLFRLLKKWITLELQRPPFYVVNQEGKITIELANIEYQLRIDRIDQLEDGQLLIIDYKTGQVSAVDWWGDRPDDPQLPLYSLSDPSIAGIVFGQINNKKLGFTGLTAQDFAIDGVKSISDTSVKHAENSWQQQRQSWQYILTKLSQQFQQGYADRDPKYQQQTCHRCHLKMLCRIDTEEY